MRLRLVLATPLRVKERNQCHSWLVFFPSFYGLWASLGSLTSMSESGVLHGWILGGLDLILDDLRCRQEAGDRAWLSH